MARAQAAASADCDALLTAAGLCAVLAVALLAHRWSKQVADGRFSHEMFVAMAACASAALLVVHGRDC